LELAAQFDGLRLPFRERRFGFLTVLDPRLDRVGFGLSCSVGNLEIAGSEGPPARRGADVREGRWPLPLRESEQQKRRPDRQT
jgi:hypothetical protein